MINEIAQWFVSAIPFIVASYHSGYNHFVDVFAMRDYAEAFVISKEKT